jgi:hypothetical protein
MLSPPASAKRFHTMEAYYAYHRSHKHHRGVKSHHRSDTRKASVTSDNHRPKGLRPLAAVAAVPYLYSTVSVDKTPTTFDDRFVGHTAYRP